MAIVLFAVAILFAGLGGYFLGMVAGKKSLWSEDFITRTIEVTSIGCNTIINSSSDAYGNRHLYVACDMTGDDGSDDVLEEPPVDFDFANRN